MSLTAWRTYATKTPRFLQTLSESSKPPLTKPYTINKPFGLPAPVLLNPQHAHNKWSLTKEVFSEEAKDQRQKKLDHEIKHSPFYETKSFTNTNGKIFTPPISYFKGDKSKYFPDFIGTALDNSTQKLYELLKNKVTLVRVYATVSGDRCSESYFKVGDKNYLTKDYEEFKQTYPLTQIVDINIPQNWAKRALVNLSKGNLRKLVPQDRHRSYFIVNENLISFDIKEELYCDNSCSGYIYMLDHNGKVRWATSGFSDQKELDLFYKCLRGLEKELASLMK